MILPLLLALSHAPALAQSAPGEPPSAPAVSTSGSFALNKSALTPAGEEALGPWLAHLQAHPGWVFEVSVHTDSMGSESYNQTLSQRRAEAAREALIAAGAPAGQLEAHGYGESRPVAPNDTESGRAQNRRLELTALRPLDGTAPTVSGPAVSGPAASGPSEAAPQPAAPAYVGPTEWQVLKRELSGALGSGDEQREGKLQVDRVRFEVGFDARVEAYHFHGQGVAPTAVLVGPSGERVPVKLGKSELNLAPGVWTLEVRDSKRAEGPWGLRVQAISPEGPLAPGADDCTTLRYVVAQSQLDMRDARGPKLDDNFDVGPSVPGLPGEGKVHHAGEYWLPLYDGDDPGAADQAWAQAEATLGRCLGAGWEREAQPWTEMVPRFQSAGFESFEVREVTLEDSASGVRVQLEQERWSTKEETILRIYLPSR